MHRLGNVVFNLLFWTLALIVMIPFLAAFLFVGLIQTLAHHPPKWWTTRP